MLAMDQCKYLIDLLHREVVPAMGCTEPVAVALCAARAAEMLGSLPQRVEVELSMNVLKNAMGVGIPGTGMIGLPIAIALGMIVGKSSYQLEVLIEVTPEAVELGESLIVEGAKEYVIDDAELQHVQDNYPVIWKNPDATPKLCFVGCPHLSLQQLKDWTEKVEQGITTVIAGQCGGSVCGADAPEFLDGAKDAALGVNMGLLIGHGTLRRAVIGTSAREPSAEELEKMKKREI